MVTDVASQENSKGFEEKVGEAKLQTLALGDYLNLKAVRKNRVHLVVRMVKFLESSI